MGIRVLTLHSEDEFKAAFSDLVREAYVDLFGIRGEEAWTMSKSDLIGYFRSADKTSEIIGSRQASVFTALSELSGYIVASSAGSKAKPAASSGAKKRTKKSSPAASVKAAEIKVGNAEPSVKAKGDMAFTVRIEINLPAEGTAETYDTIFKSIRANLFP